MRCIFRLLIFVVWASPAFAEGPVPLGLQSNAPHYIPLKKNAAPRSLKQVKPGHFMALPPRSNVGSSIRIVRGRSFPLPARNDGVAASSTKEASTPKAPATVSVAAPAPPKESDAAMAATVSTQAAVSRQGAQLVDPIDLLIANKAKK